MTLGGAIAHVGVTMERSAPAHDVHIIQSWGFSRTEAIKAARRWALRCLTRDGTDTDMLCYLQGLNGLMSASTADPSLPGVAPYADTGS